MLDAETYKQAAHSAIEKLEDDVTQAFDTCINPGNRAVVLFLQELKAQAMRDPDGADTQSSTYVQALAKAIKGVKNHPVRLHDEASLVKVSGIGARMSKVILNHLWSIHPPAPLNEEEQLELDKQEEAERAVKADKRKRQADARKAARDAKKQVEQGGTAAALNPIGAAVGASALGGVDEDGAGGASKKQRTKAKKEKKEYLPSYRSANYAFMIVLYQAKMKGETFLTKQQIMDRAEASGLADKSIHGTGQRTGGFNPNPQNFYDGWSNFKKLVNNDPPLVQKWSNPVKVRLTPEGEAMALRLYRNAVLRHDVHGQLPDDPTDEDEPAAPDDPATKGKFTSLAVRGAAAVRSGDSVPALLLNGASGHQHVPPSNAIKAPPRCNDDGNDAIDLISDDDDFNGNDNPLAAPLSQSLSNFGNALPRSTSLTGPTAAAVPQHNPAPTTNHLQLPQPPGPDSRAARAASAQLPPLPTARPAKSGTLLSRGRGAAAPAGSVADSVNAPSTSMMCQHTGVDRWTAQWKLRKLGGDSGTTQGTLRLPPLAPGQRFGDVYQILLLVDNREQFSRHVGGGQVMDRNESRATYVNRLRERGCDVCEAHLGIGDIVWVAKHHSSGVRYMLDYIVERKDVKDLVSSIKEKRYERQKYSLLRCGLRYVYYLVEGDPDGMLSLVEAKMVKSASVFTELHDGFKVLRTANVNETISLYCTMTHKLQSMFASITAEDPRVSCTSGDALPTYEQFSAVVAASKQTTVRDVWGKMLTAVQGVSGQVAEAILAQYSTPRALLMAYRSAAAKAVRIACDPKREIENVLAGTEVAPEYRVSKLMSWRIYCTFFREDPRQ